MARPVGEWWWTLEKRMWPWLLASAVCALGQACIITGSKCDARERHVTEGQLDYCACAPGAVMDPKGYGCVRCGANEEVQNDKCVCSEGFSRASVEAACEASEGQAIGVTCEAAADCGEPFPHCATDADERYCTKQGCAEDACPTGYSCETLSGMTLCAKLPSGIDEPCTSNADCSAFKASECDTFNGRCVLGGCAVGKLRCPTSWSCCDLSAVVPGASFCAAPTAMCFGKVVTP